MKSITRAQRSAFTLIELLTVIAIIAILAAIIFPVFGAVTENARRTSCMTNMKQLSTAARQYELDNRRLPDFLMTPALKRFSGGNGEINLNGSGCAGLDGATVPSQRNKPIAASAGDDACTMEQASATGKLGGEVYVATSNGYALLGTGSLYPEYIKSYSAFHCPNNSWFDRTGSEDYDKTNPSEYPVTAPIVRYDSATKTPDDVNAARYYRYDSYDANPVLGKNGNGQPNGKIGAAQGDWRLRYSRQWMPVQSDPAALGSLDEVNRDFYSKQLLWSEPSDDTYLTMCSFHGEKGKITTVTLGGTARVVDTRSLADPANKTQPLDLNNDFDMFRIKP